MRLRHLQSDNTRRRLRPGLNLRPTLLLSLVLTAALRRMERESGLLLLSMTLQTVRRSC